MSKNKYVASLETLCFHSYPLLSEIPLTLKTLASDVLQPYCKLLQRCQRKIHKLAQKTKDGRIHNEKLTQLHSKSTEKIPTLDVDLSGTATVHGSYCRSFQNDAFLASRSSAVSVLLNLRFRNLFANSII